MGRLMFFATLVALTLTTITEKHSQDTVTGTQLVLLIPETDADLPCPWCYAPTGEDDVECASCRQTFG